MLRLVRALADHIMQYELKSHKHAQIVRLIVNCIFSGHAVSLMTLQEAL